MTLPEGVKPSSGAEETPVEPTIAEEPVVTEPVITEDSTTEDASDAALRAWAKENGIEGVPASGKLSAVWRDQITTAMAVALDPKDEVSVAPEDSPESSTSETTTEEPASGSSGEEETSPPTEEPVAVQPEFETGEYRSVFKAPNTFVSGQAYTA
jgi:hypothetical protein